MVRATYRGVAACASVQPGHAFDRVTGVSVASSREGRHKGMIGAARMLLKLLQRITTIFYWARTRPLKTLHLQLKRQVSAGRTPALIPKTYSKARSKGVRTTFG